MTLALLAYPLAIKSAKEYLKEGARKRFSGRECQDKSTRKKLPGRNYQEETTRKRLADRTRANYRNALIRKLA